MKILITGGAGMVGSHTALHYASKGDEVIVFDNLMRSKLFGYDKKSVEYNWNFLAGQKNIKRVLGDVRNPKDLKKVVSADLDAIIHTAGQPGVGFSINDPAEDYSINAFGSFNVLECVRKVCPKTTFVYCSTNKVYGENVSELALAEESKRYSFRDIKAISETFNLDLTGHTPYGVSKYVGDLYAQEYGYSYGLKAGIFRMSCTYGTRQFGFEDQGWLAHFIISNLTDKPITIYGDGKQVRDILYVEDLVRAFDLFIKSDLKTEVFNIGGGPDNTISLLEFIEMIEQKTGNKMKKGFDKWRPSDQKVYISDISKVKKILSWQPQIDASRGIDKLISWVKENLSFFK
ncbi:MAG: NAD-dependent epimerase/dehydratase family protein [Candidatus Omnitrophica bacterium]|nr:NAD-dependent epimerase/dehydratase family protein [Candidatus Omnitrophota bacterium]